MPRPSQLTCTTASPATTQPPSPPPTTKRRGNPALALVPRCGARTRAGCPCRAPAIHGKLRCRMHGGRSTGPRTEEGRARIAAAHTTHGHSGAEDRAFTRHHVTFLRRSTVRMFAVIHRDRLPPELAARMCPLPPELCFPPRPTRGISRAEDRALLQAETAALAPWKQAMVLARQARRDARAARAAAKAAARSRPHAPEQAASAVATGSAASAPAVPRAQPKPHASIAPAPARAKPHAAPGSGRLVPSMELHALERAAPGGGGTPAPANPAALPEAHTPIPPATAQPALQPAAASDGAASLAEPRAPERTAHGARNAPAPANRAGQPKPLAPIPPAPTQPAPHPAPASAHAEPSAKPLAPERAAHGPRDALPPVNPAALPKAQAPIPPAPAQPAPPGARAAAVAEPLAPDRAAQGANSAAASAGLPARPEAHAPERARTPDRVSRPIPVHKAARRWLRQQQRMHPNQVEGLLE